MAAASAWSPPAISPSPPSWRVRLTRSARPHPAVIGPYVMRRHRRAAGAALFPDRRSVRRRRGAAHRPGARGRGAGRTGRARSRRSPMPLLAGRPRPMARAKRLITDVAGKPIDANAGRNRPPHRRDPRQRRRQGGRCRLPREAQAELALRVGRTRGRVLENPDRQSRRDRLPRSSARRGEMGIRTVAVYSDADADALHVQSADEAVRHRPGAGRGKLSRHRRHHDAAHRTGTEAIHPGYGFLSRERRLRRGLRENGVVFIGPPPGAIRAMGSKSAAKATHGARPRCRWCRAITAMTRTSRRCARRPTRSAIPC